MSHNLILWTFVLLESMNNDKKGLPFEPHFGQKIWQKNIHRDLSPVLFLVRILYLALWTRTWLLRADCVYVIRQGTLVYSHLSSLSHCGLILGFKEWNWCVWADFYARERKKKKAQLRNGSLDFSHSPHRKSHTDKIHQHFFYHYYCMSRFSKRFFFSSLFLVNAHHFVEQVTTDLHRREEQTCGASLRCASRVWRSQSNHLYHRRFWLQSTLGQVSQCFCSSLHFLDVLVSFYPFFFFGGGGGWWGGG